MHVLQLLNAFLTVVHVEVIIPPLPELLFSRYLQLARGLLLENLNCRLQLCQPSLSNQEVDVLGHEHVAREHEAIAPPYHLKFVLEDPVCRSAVKQRLAPVATERDEVEYPALLEASMVLRHGQGILYRVLGRGQCCPTFAR